MLRPDGEPINSLLRKTKIQMQSQHPPTLLTQALRLGDHHLLLEYALRISLYPPCQNSLSKYIFQTVTPQEEFW